MLSYLDDFKDVLARGEPEKRKDFIRMFVKSVIMCPASRQAKIRFYIRPLSDIIKEEKECELTEEVIYQS